MLDIIIYGIINPIFDKLFEFLGNLTFRFTHKGNNNFDDNKEMSREKLRRLGFMIFMLLLILVCLCLYLVIR